MCFSEPALAQEAGAGSVQSGLPRLESGDAALPEVSLDQPAVILYTSGTTARPKGAIHSHRTLLENSRLIFNSQDTIRQGSLGVAITGVQVRIVDFSDRDVPEGEIGEIAVLGPGNCIGYWNDPRATETLIRNGWMHTGDLACRDSDGYYWFQGRGKEIIVRGGSNISPQEVEEALYQHPSVMEVGVIGITAISTPVSTADGAQRQHA